MSFTKDLVKSLIQPVFIFFIIASQVVLFSGFEASIINVTARICVYVESRTIGFWKNHFDIILDQGYLPQYIGGYQPDEEIWLPDVQTIFDEADADVMVDMLRAQLLGMKFNVAHFPGTGDFEYGGMTIFEMIEMADDMLRMDPLPPRDDLEYMKDLLNYLNNQHQLTHCAEPDSGLTLFVILSQWGCCFKRMNEH